MKKQDTQSWGRIALLLWLAISVHASAQSARVAVAGDPSLANLIDASTAQLSTEPELTVLERTDLDKLGQEQALQTVLGSNDFSPVRLLPADGLVLLRAVKQDGKIGVFARLVAVQPGVILREVALPDGADPLAQAQALVKEFAPYWSKLAALQQGKITALSLLGLRFEVDAPETREMERRINVLLASRLSAEPDTLVLERWRLNDAVFEKSLNAQQPAPFWTGSSLIVGTMKWESNKVEVTLRVRPSQGAEVSISDADTADHLPGLVGRLADKIRNHPMAQGGWQPAAEAAHYAELGSWCLDNHLYDEGAEAIESALALGDGSRTTHMLQVRAYALLAYPDDLRDLDSDYGFGVKEITSEELPARVQSGALAADLTCDYLKVNHDFSGPSGTLEDPIELSLPVLNNCLRTLRMAYDKGFQRDHGDEVGDLRHKVQKLIAQMAEYLAEKPSEKQVYFLKYKIRYAAFWHETPEETLAYYRELLNRKTDGTAIREELFVWGFPNSNFHPPYLDAGADTDDTPIWELGSPWIVAWDDRSPDEIKALWQDFLKELAASPDPVLQADALKFTFGSTQTDQMQNDTLRQTVAFLQQHPEGGSGPRGNDFADGFFGIFLWALKPENATYRDQLLHLYENLFKQHVVLAPEWIDQLPFFFRDQTKAYIGYQNRSDDSQRILPIFDAYQQWYQTQVPQDEEVVKALARARRSFYDPKAEEALKKAMADSLPVHLHWPSYADMEKPAGLYIASGALMTADNQIWCMEYPTSQGPPEILCIDPSTLQIVSSYPIPDQYAHTNAIESGWLAATPQWLVAGFHGQALLCSRTSNQWRALDVPPSNYRPRWIDQELYLLYASGSPDHLTNNNGAAAIVSGLIHVSIPDGKIENVVSSRRIPPQNALDGQSLGFPLDLWSSPAGLMLAYDADAPHFQVFASSLGKNDWTSVATDPMWCEVKVGAKGALIVKDWGEHGFAQLVLMKGTVGQVLLSNPDRVKASDAEIPLWNLPDEIRTASPAEIWQASPVMRGDDLCLYRNVINGTGDSFEACLYYFSKGQKNGLKIPLTFDSQGIKNPMYARIRSAIVGYQSVQATDYGLVIEQIWHGFWVIPWRDIDAYRARVAAQGAAPAPIAPVASTPP